MITLHLTRGKDLEGIYIRLPAPQEKIEEAMTRLDAISEDRKIPQRTSAEKFSIWTEQGKMSILSS